MVRFVCVRSSAWNECEGAWHRNKHLKIRYVSSYAAGWEFSLYMRWQKNICASLNSSSKSTPTSDEEDKTRKGTMRLLRTIITVHLDCRMYITIIINIGMYAMACAAAIYEFGCLGMRASCAYQIHRSRQMAHHHQWLTWIDKYVHKWICYTDMLWNEQRGFEMALHCQ